MSDNFSMHNLTGAPSSKERKRIKRAAAAQKKALKEAASSDSSEASPLAPRQNKKFKRSMKVAQEASAVQFYVFDNLRDLAEAEVRGPSAPMTREWEPPTPSLVV